MNRVSWTVYNAFAEYLVRNEMVRIEREEYPNGTKRILKYISKDTGQAVAESVGNAEDNYHYYIDTFFV